MAKLPTIEEMARNVAEKALDEVEYNGKTIREWTEIILATASEDTISRQAAIDALRKMQTYKLFSGDNMLLIDQAGAQTELMLLPPIQPKRGMWIPVDSFTAFGGDEATWMAHGNPTAFHYCSVCKGQAYAGEDGESLLTNFCPNCGADMRVD